MNKRESLNILFVCSMNKWRSPTAEKIFSDHPLINVRSCGTNRQAVKTVNAATLAWADAVLVMERKHHNRLTSQFPGEMRFKEIHILDIPDNYRFMDPELVDEIKSAVEPLVQQWQNSQ